jgi:hypothetical protein
MITTNQLADAIYRAEGGNHTAYPYGIVAHYKHTTPRAACLNTIHTAMGKYHVTIINRHFITLLFATYCPVSADKQGNINWQKNVIQILHL